MRVLVREESKPTAQGARSGKSYRLHSMADLNAPRHPTRAEPDTERDRLASTRSTAEVFNPLKLAALCGGLQLLPPNIHRLWRFQAMAAMSLDTPDRPASAIQRSEIYDGS
jgi:hypothetical protein